MTDTVEQYVVIVDGVFLTEEPVSRRRAMALSLEQVGWDRDCLEVLILESTLLESRACWSRLADGWRLQAQAGWLEPVRAAS